MPEAPAVSAVHILFVCMGNICRSPTAEGVMRTKLQAAGLAGRVSVDSAGTHNFRPGEAPDPRSQRHASARGYDLSGLRARQIDDGDFERANWVLVMDWDNLALAEAACPPGHARKIRRLTEFCRRHTATVVPDPYGLGPEAFEQALDLIEDACEGLLARLQRTDTEPGGSALSP